MQINILIHIFSAILFLFLLKKMFKNLFKSKIDIAKEKLEQYNTYLRQTLMYKPNFNAFEYITDMTQQLITPDVDTFNILIHTSIEQGNFTQATEILEAMQTKYQMSPDSKTILSFFKGIQSFKSTSKSISQSDIKKIIKRIYKIVKHNYLQLNILIGWMIKFNLIDSALYYYEKHKNKNNNQLGRSIIRSLKHPSIDNIEKFYKKILEIYDFILENDEEFKPDEIILNNLIEMCLNAGDDKKAMQIYESFKKFDIQPSSNTFGILMKGFGNIQVLEKTLFFYDQLKIHGIPLNEITLGCLIDGCIKCNEMEKAQQILENEKDLPKNTIIYTTIIKGYTKQHNLQKALEVFELMKKDPNAPPNTVTYNSMLECCIQSRNYDKLKAIFNECLENKNQNQEADLISYSTYIKGLCKFGKIKEALKIYNELRDVKIYQIDEILYNSILDGLCKAGEYNLAFEIYEKMKEDKVALSNITYSILIKLYTNIGKYDESIKILDEMRESNVAPGLIVYTCLVQTYVKTKRMNEIINMYYEMQKNGILMDKVFYNTIVSGLIFNYSIPEAISIANDAFMSQIIMNQQVYDNLMANLKKFQKDQILENEYEIMKLFRYLNRYKINVDLKVYNQIVYVLVI